MAKLGDHEMTLKITAELTEELKQLIRQLIREELAGEFRDIVRQLQQSTGSRDEPIRDAAARYTKIAEGK
jgi:hypothetical protein